jgi:hypothetical protein
MPPDASLDRLAQSLDRLALTVGQEAERLAWSPAPGAALRALFYEEVTRSCALAGSRFSNAEVRALLEGDSVSPGRSLSEHELVADYGEAARVVSTAALPRRRAFLAIDEIAALQALVVRRASGARPGRWRERTQRAFPSGMVPPPAWLIPREMAAFVERFAGGPRGDANRLAWIADAHARLRRLQPFDTANGRTTRLVTNLLLRRIGLPPFIIRRRDAARYAAALGRAESKEPGPLALVIGRSLHETLGALPAGGTEAKPAAEPGAGALRPVAEFAAGAARAALYKAAQRDRLQTVRRGEALLTTQEWIDAYRDERYRRQVTP